MNFESDNDVLKDLGIEDQAPPTVKHFGDLTKKIVVQDVETPIDSNMSPEDFDDFHGVKPPQVNIQREKPEHRLLILLKAKGMSNVEISEATGYSKVALSNLFRQPWARKRLATIMQASGKDVVTTILESAAADSVYKLIELRDNEKVQPSVQRAACVDLLDRFLGKPTQQVDVRHEEVSSTDIGELNKKIEVLEKEENRLLGLSQ